MISRSFFNLAILFSCISGIIQLFFIIAFNHPDSVSLTLDDVELLFWSVTIASTLNSIIFFIYVRWRGFQLLAFSVILSGIGYPILIYCLWMAINYELSWDGYNFVFRLQECSYLFISIATLTTKAKERKWLRYWAVYSLIFVLISLSFSFAGEVGPELRRISELAGYAGMVLVLFDILNYLSERKMLKIEDEGVLDTE